MSLKVGRPYCGNAHPYGTWDIIGGDMTTVKAAFTVVLPVWHADGWTLYGTLA